LNEEPAADTAASRRTSFLVFIGIAAAILLVDQVTKALAASQLPPGDTVRVWGDLVRLTLVRNRGAAFGLLQGNIPFLVLASIAAIGVVAYALVLLPPDRHRDRIALGLVGGGALGNLVDRVRLGEVVDFLDVGWGDRYRWPTFNVADSAVTLGVALMFLWVGRSRRAAEVAAPEAPAPPDGTPLEPRT
jgi:signal peptidase II